MEPMEDSDEPKRDLMESDAVVTDEEGRPRFRCEVLHKGGGGRRNDSEGGLLRKLFGD